MKLHLKVIFAMRKRQAARAIPAARASEADHNLPPVARALMLRLFSVLKANNAVLPGQMLREIEAISLKGVNPQWQIAEMQKILDRYMTQH